MRLSISVATIAILLALSILTPRTEANSAVCLTMGQLASYAGGSGQVLQVLNDNGVVSGLQMKLGFFFSAPASWTIQRLGLNVSSANAGDTVSVWAPTSCRPIVWLPEELAPAPAPAPAVSCNITVANLFSFGIVTDAPGTVLGLLSDASGNVSGAVVRLNLDQAISLASQGWTLQGDNPNVRSAWSPGHCRPLKLR